LLDAAAIAPALKVKPGTLASPLAADAAFVPSLIETGSTAPGLKQARTTAAKVLKDYPSKGCAAHLSALLQQTDMVVPMTFGAGKLAHTPSDPGWFRVLSGSQQPGNVGVCFDNTSPPGADYVYLGISTQVADRMVIADNQNDAPHERFASGAGKTSTEYCLRVETIP